MNTENSERILYHMKSMVLRMRNYRIEHGTEHPKSEEYWNEISADYNVLDQRLKDSFDYFVK